MREVTNQGRTKGGIVQAGGLAQLKKQGHRWRVRKGRRRGEEGAHQGGVVHAGGLALLIEKAQVDVLAAGDADARLPPPCVGPTTGFRKRSAQAQLVGIRAGRKRVEAANATQCCLQSASPEQHSYECQVQQNMTF